jgi:hypothetical protein
MSCIGPFIEHPAAFFIRVHSAFVAEGYSGEVGSAVPFLCRFPEFLSSRFTPLFLVCWWSTFALCDLAPLREEVLFWSPGGLTRGEGMWYQSECLNPQIPQITPTKKPLKAHLGNLCNLRIRPLRMFIERFWGRVRGR